MSDAPAAAPYSAAGSTATSATPVDGRSGTRQTSRTDAGEKNQELVGGSTKKPKKGDGGPQDKDEQANTNKETENLEHLDPLDEGATQLKHKTKKIKELDEGLDTGPTPEMRFPYLDIEPNSITSRNVDDWEVNLIARVKKPKIDYESLAYEAVVGSLSGHKRAFNSSEYGRLNPTIDIDFLPKAAKKQVWKIDSESLQDSLAEAAFGYKKTNTALADDFKRNMRTFVLPNNSDHGGPTMFRRGFNQYRNKAIRKRAQDPAPDSVQMATQNARDAFVLNDQVLYANTNQKLQFKAGHNEAKVIPDSSNTGHIAPPNTSFGVSGSGLSNDRSFGYSQASAELHRNSGTLLGGTFRSGPQRLSAAFESQMPHAASLPNTGVYATHSTAGGIPATLGQAPRTMGM